MSNTETTTLSVRALIRLIIEDGVGPDYHDVAVKVYEALPANQRDEALKQVLPEICLRVQGQIRMKVRKQDISKALQALEEDPTKERLSIFDMAIHIEGKKHLFFGDTNKEDNLWLAKEYVQSSRESQFYASVHHQIAKKCGKKTVREVFTEEELLQIFRRQEK